MANTKSTPKRKRTTTASNQTKVMTTGSVIRIEQPNSARGRKPTITTVISEAEINPVGGFFNFLREHAVVGLAVGFAIGSQAQLLVKQLVASFIDPAFNLFLGKDGLEKKTFTMHLNKNTAQFSWGLFVYSLLDFLFVLAAIYFIIRFFNLDKLDKPKKK